MKSPLLLLLLFSIQLFSQDYVPLLKKDAFWDVGEVTRFSRSPCSINSISRDQIGKDTIIANKTYKKIKRYPVVGTRSGYYNCLKAPYLIDTTNYNFSEYYFREDISEKKVYRLRIENNEKIEEIYYDFSLKVGDTLKYNVFWNKDFSIVKKIEQDSNGKKKFIFDNSGDGTIGGYYYTEGLGGKFGFFHRTNYDWMDVYPSLYCFGNDMLNNNCHISVETNYNDEGSDEIEDENYGEDQNNSEENQLKVFPNPTKSILYIENKDNTTIKIFSIKGKLLKQIISDTDFEIDVTLFSSGLYFLEISNLSSREKRKFIKI